MEINFSGNLRPRKKNTRKTIYICIAVVVVLMALYVAAAYVIFSSRFIPGTVIDGINCGLITEAEAQTLLENVVTDYRLQITDGKDIAEYITSGDIEMKGSFEDELNQALSGQNRLTWGIGLFKKTDVATEPVVEFNPEMLNNKIGELTLVSGEQVTDSVNAYLKLNDANRYEVVPEVYGTRLDREEFTGRVTEAIKALEPVIDLSKEDYYIKPTVYSDNEAMLAAMENANKWLGSVITYTFGSSQEVVDDSVIKDWIVIGNDFSAFFDRDKVKEFVRGLSRKYDTFGDTRTIKTTYGFDVSVIGGNYGYRINREAEIDGLVTDIKAGETKARTPVYYQEGASYDGLDIGNTYVEIDLTGQHLFLYQDNSLILQTEIVSGQPSKGATPNGTYRITYCERDAILRGEDYETPVSYWMPFNGDIGLHDAIWQPKFGGDWYVKHGSHGCINLPLSVAAQIYSYAYKGMPVVCYRYDTNYYSQVDAYRKANNLPAIFDTDATGNTANQ